MEKNEIISVNGSSIVMYTSEDGTTSLDVKLENETVWLSVEQMAMLFDRDRTVITRHINKIFKEGFTFPLLYIRFFKRDVSWRVSQ